MDLELIHLSHILRTGYPSAWSRIIILPINKLFSIGSELLSAKEIYVIVTGLTKNTNNKEECYY